MVSGTLIDDPFEDDPKIAEEFLEENIGIFMACITAAGTANIDLIELIRIHQAQRATAIRNR